jgi:protein-arginine kinase activator protein McsA
MDNIIKNLRNAAERCPVCAEKLKKYENVERYNCVQCNQDFEPDIKALALGFSVLKVIE